MATLLESRELQMKFYIKHKLIKLKNLLVGPNKRLRRAGFDPLAVLCHPDRRESGELNPLVDYIKYGWLLALIPLLNTPAPTPK